MAERDRRGFRPVGRVVVPRDDVEVFSPFEVVKRLVSTHKIGGHCDVRGVLLDPLILTEVTLEQAVGLKAVVVEGDPLKRRAGMVKLAQVFAEDIGRNDLLPVVKGVSPKTGVPAFVDLFERVRTLVAARRETPWRNCRSNSTLRTRWRRAMRRGSDDLCTARRCARQVRPSSGGRWGCWDTSYAARRIGACVPGNRRGAHRGNAAAIQAGCAAVEVARHV